MRKPDMITLSQGWIVFKQGLLHFGLALIVLSLFSPPLPALAATDISNTDNSLLQYVSGGHVLGFAPDGVYAGTGSHALRIEFVNGTTARPAAGSAAGNQDAAAPLDKVTYTGVWDGVDIAYTSATGAIYESTYHLTLPESAGSIRLHYNRPISIDNQGNLVISFENGSMRESAPIAWQEIDGLKTGVQAGFVIYDGQEVGFTLAGCRPGLAVTIDPWLTWNTFLGSTDQDSGNAIALDAMGNVYIAGYSDATWGSPVRPLQSGGDGFVAKLSNNGGLVWNTFLGGDGDDRAWGIALDPNGNIYVVGSSSETWGTPKREFSDFIDAYVARLSNNGDLIWNTFLGGTGPDGGYGITTDAAGNVYAAGSSYSSWESPKWDPGGHDHAFAAKLTGNGVLTWNTFLGGTGEDAAFDIGVDPDTNVYIAGYSDTTWGSPVRAYTNSFDGFAAKLNSLGVLQWNTFLGSTGYDNCLGIVADAAGNSYVTGAGATSWGNPVQVFGTGYAAKLNSNGNLVWNTCLGGIGPDGGPAEIVIDPAGNLYIAGASFETWGNPERPFTPSLLPNYTDGFAAGLTNSGRLIWNTFLGSSHTESCSDIAVDAGGNVYVSGTGNATWESPVRPYSYGITPGPEPSQTEDAFAARIHPVDIKQASFNTTLGTVNLNTDAGSIANSGWTPAAEIRCSAPSGFIFPYGMFSFNLTHLSAGQTARVTLRFPTPLPLATKYFKCINGSMVDCTSLVTRIDEYTLVLALTDGGLGDADGQANGTFVDPGGPAFPLGTPQSSSAQMPATAPQKPVSLSNISVKSASLSSVKVTPGTPVTVTAIMSNTGTGNGAGNIKVYVNGAEESSQGVSVNSGSTVTITFDVTRNEPGTYTVYVNGTQAGSFTVDQFTPDIILIISGALVFFSLILGTIVITRRRSG